MGRAAPAVESLCVIIRHRHPNILAAAPSALSPSHRIFMIRRKDTSSAHGASRKTSTILSEVGLFELTLTIESNYKYSTCSWLIYALTPQIVKGFERKV